MAGAMGNCYDRLAFGYVRDFVHFHVDAIGFDCAIFNFADNMLIAGALTLVLYALRPEKAPSPEPQGPAAAASYLPANDASAENSLSCEHAKPADADSVAGTIRSRGAHSAAPSSHSVGSVRSTA